MTKMQCSRSFLFQLCLSLVVSTGSCSCKPVSNDIESEEPDRYYSQLSERDLFEEEDTVSRLENLLGNVKEGFLRQLNMSDVPQEQGKIFPPQFMVELYNKYVSNATAVPESDVIRSFTIQDVSHSARNGTKSRHRMLFNISVPHYEQVTIAELRLFTRADGGSGSSVNYHGVKATIKVYEVDYEEPKRLTHLLDGKEVIGLSDQWEAFDVTNAIQHQIKSGHGASEFEVVVDSKHCTASKGGGGRGCLDVSVSVGDNTSAALIVFSDDLGSRKREAKKELKEMILHEEETILSSGPSWHGGGQATNEIPVDSQPRRKRRQADGNYCRKTSLKVNFRDIGWDKWIVAPPEYDAFECRGLCYHPLTDEMTPSKHALIQTLINLRNPKKANMACCVPIKLDPITVMYQENGQITIRHVYEEMKVAECGCR